MNSPRTNPPASEIYEPVPAVLLQDVKAALIGRGWVISVSGPDGAGKSSLTLSLEHYLKSMGIEIERFHIHQWRRNLFEVPGMLRNQKEAGHIIILDRSFRDNIVEISRKLGLPRPFFRALLYLFSPVTRAIDIDLMVTAPLETLQKRRPEEDPSRLNQITSLYHAMGAQQGTTTLPSNAETLEIAFAEILANVEQSTKAKA